MSPVLQPRGQIPSVQIHDLNDRGGKDLSKSPAKSQEEEDLQLAIELSQQENRPEMLEKDLELALELSQSDAGHVENHSVEDDYQLALQLSQEDAGRVSPRAESRDPSQEDRDRKLAEELQREFDREMAPPRNPTPSPSPPRVPFSFDIDIHGNSGSTNVNVATYDDDLPDIPDIGWNVAETHGAKVDNSSPQSNSPFKNVTPLKSYSPSKPGPSRPRYSNSRVRTIHDISAVSDEEDHKTSHDRDPDNIINNSKVKGKGKKKGASPSTGLKSPNVSGNVSRSRKKTPGSGGKEYVPRHRSGAYAVLLTLHAERNKDEYRGFLTKAGCILIKAVN